MQHQPMAHGWTANDNRDIRVRAWYSHYVPCAAVSGEGSGRELKRYFTGEISVLYDTSD